MWNFNLRTWLHKVSSKLFRHPIRRARPSEDIRRAARLRMEMLEDRLLPATFTVTDTSDNASDTGSLRYAIDNLASGSAASTNTINFSLPSGSTVTLSNGALTISQGVTISGPGADLLSVSGNNASNVFTINSFGVSVTMSGLTITGGNSSYGAGLLVNAGTLTANNVVVSGNQATQNGNGGGGIYAGAAGVVTMSNSAIINNTSAGVGAGIYEYLGSSVTLTNCTLAGNSAASNGGGIYTYAPLTLADCTLSTNSGFIGGGIYINGTTTVGLGNTIVAGNSGSDPDVHGTFADDDYNLIGSTTGSSGFTGSHDHKNVSADLSALGSYGGPTETMALEAGSPALGAGNPNAGGLPTTDERGFARIVSGAVDIGAFQTQSNPYQVNATDDSATGGTAAGSLTLRDAVNLDNALAPSSGATITFDSTVFATAQTITLDGTALTLTNTSGTQTITGPAAGVTVSGNNASRVFVINSGVTASVSGLTITGGNATGSGSAGSGGAIDNLGTLMLNNATISGNTSSGNGGGGVGGNLYDAGTATVTNCIISGNTGFGVDTPNAPNTTILTNCTISNNTSNGLELGGGSTTLTNCTVSGNLAGGGVRAYLTDLTINDCTVSGNSDPGGDGGGVQSRLGSLSITDSTISGNSSAFGGGLNLNPSGPYTLTNCTISDNTATSQGGGVWSNGSPTFVNTIVAGNTAPTGPDVYDASAVTDNGYNLIGNTSGSSGFSSANHDQLNVSADLTALGYYGGPTQTMLPEGGSPAIGNGNNTGGPSTDQRGFTRVTSTGGDIGADEGTLYTVTTNADSSGPPAGSFAPTSPAPTPHQAAASSSSRRAYPGTRSRWTERRCRLSRATCRSTALERASSPLAATARARFSTSSRARSRSPA